MSSQSDSQPVLSVSLIVRNVADRLRPTLESIRDIADEIFVLDTGSTDDTKQIALEYTSQVHETKWNDDFSEARNACWPHLKGKWVLWLDAGETLDPADAVALKQQLIESPECNTAYLLYVQVEKSGADVSGEQVARVRLVPNREGIAFRGRVNEEMISSLRELGIGFDSLPFAIRRGQWHCLPSVKARRAKRNATLADIEVRSSGPSAGVLNLIGQAFHDLAENKQAREFFEKSILIAEKGSVDMLEAYYGCLAAISEGGGTREEQAEICLKGLEEFPVDKQLLCAIGGYLHTEGKLDLAIRSYRTAVEHGVVNGLAWHLKEIDEIAVACLGAALQLDRKVDEAIDIVEQAIEQLPNSSRLRRLQFDLYIQQGDLTKATEVLSGMLGEKYDRTTVSDLAAGALAATRQDWGSAISLLEGLHRDGCDDVLCLRWLTISYLAAKKISKANEVMTLWESLDSNGSEVKQLRQKAAQVVKANDESSSSRYDFPSNHDPALVKSADRATNGLQE